MSEKSDKLKDQEGKYTFLVDRKASKLDVKKAVETLFEVKVAQVNTLLTRGKFKRRGMYASLQPTLKKAVVKLQSGQKIGFFEEK